MKKTLEKRTFERLSLRELIRAGATFFINHSGGKDSQAMTARLVKIIPIKQLVIVHAILPGVDWEGLVEHIEANSFGIPVYTCQAKKTFFQMVRNRRMFPSPKYRQCTSDLKRGPLEKLIRQICKDRGITLLVSCDGRRAEESSDRAKLPSWSINSRQSVAGRIWNEWRPILSKIHRQVMLAIKVAGQRPHWVYGVGLNRCSCKICIFSSDEDIKTVYRIDRAGFDQYADTEEEIEFAFIMPKKNQPARTLRQIVGVKPLS